MIDIQLVDIQLKGKALLTGIPDGLGMRIRAKDTAGTLNSRIRKLVDNVGNIEAASISTPTSPLLTTDSQGRKFLRFDTSRNTHLIASNLNIDAWSDSTGTKLSFLFVANFDKLQRQTPLEWYQGAAGSWDTDNHVTTYLPWIDGHAYFEFGSVASRIVTTTPPANPTGRIVSYFVERDGANGKIYLNGQLIQETSNLTSQLVKGTTGVLRFGESAITSNRTVDMDFYETGFYPMVLTGAEKAQLFNYTKQEYGA